MTKLILVRHGETKRNIAHRLHHPRDAVILTEKGKAQMKVTASALRKMNVSALYSSREKRTQQSTSILSTQLNLPFKVVAGIQERNWGKSSGKPWAEIQKVLEPMTIEERYRYVPPQGESWKEFKARLTKTISKILKENEKKVVAVITHGGTIRVFMFNLLRAARKDGFKFDPENASLSVVDYEGEKVIKWSINDTSHLPEALKTTTIKAK